MSLSVYLCGDPETVSYLNDSLSSALHDVNLAQSCSSIPAEKVADFDIVVLVVDANNMNDALSLCLQLRTFTKSLHTPIVAFVTPENRNILPDISGKGFDEIFACTPLLALNDFLAKVRILHRRSQILKKMHNQLSVLGYSGDIDLLLPAGTTLHLLCHRDATSTLSPLFDGSGLSSPRADTFFRIHHSLEKMEKIVEGGVPHIIVIDLALGTVALKLASRISLLHPETPLLLLIPRERSHLVSQCSELGLGNVMVYPDHLLLLSNKLYQLKNWARYHHSYQLHLQAQLNLSIRDELTGLYNRRYLDQLLQHNLSHEIPSALMMLDLDHFKKTNDSYGHLFGDEVLRCVSEHMMRQFRPHDTVGRWGGEEFVIILEDVSSQKVRKLAERLRESIAAEPFRIPHQDDQVIDYFITMSVGISISRAEDTPASLTYRADSALYKAKDEGRNRVVFQD